MAETVLRLNPAGLSVPSVPFTRTAVAVKAGLLFISGLTSMDGRGGVSGEDIAEQTREVYRKLLVALEAHGCDFTHLVKITIFLRDAGDIAEFNKVPGDFYPPDQYPAATLIADVRMVDPKCLVEIEAIAALPRD